MCALISLRPTEWGKIVIINGGYGIRQKLLLRGISEGSIVRMVSRSQGPIVVEVDRNTVALGRGIAQRIMVTKK